MKRCQFCAEDIQDAAVVCKHCGRDVAGVGAGIVKVRQADWVSTTAKWGCGSVLALMLVTFLVASFFPSSSTPTPKIQISIDMDAIVLANDSDTDTYGRCAVEIEGDYSLSDEGDLTPRGRRRFPFGGFKSPGGVAMAENEGRARARQSVFVTCIGTDGNAFTVTRR